jgi:hypothetical protein
MKQRAQSYAPGDTDLAWTRVTLWRGLLAAALDQPPFEPVTAVTVTGGSDSPSTDLLAAWLGHYLGAPVTRNRSRAGSGVVSVRLERASGNIDLVRPEGDTATLLQPGQPDRTIALAHRSDPECLADELRRLDPDEVYEEVMTKGMRRLTGSGKGKPASEAVADGEAPSPEEAARTVKRLRRQAKRDSRSVMVEAAPEPPEESDATTVKEAAARQLATKKAEKKAEKEAERRVEKQADETREGAAPDGEGPAAEQAAAGGEEATR